MTHFYEDIISAEYFETISCKESFFIFLNFDFGKHHSLAGTVWFGQKIVIISTVFVLVQLKQTILFYFKIQLD